MGNWLWIIAAVLVVFTPVLLAYWWSARRRAADAEPQREPIMTDAMLSPTSPADGAGAGGPPSDGGATAAAPPPPPRPPRFVRFFSWIWGWMRWFGERVWQGVRWSVRKILPRLGWAKKVVKKERETSNKQPPRRILLGDVLAAVIAAILVLSDPLNGTLLVAIAIGAVVIMQLLANLNIIFTSPVESTTTYINRGQSLHAIWPNIENYRLSNAKDPGGRLWLIPEANERKREDRFFSDALFGTVWFQLWLWRRFGIRYISIWFWQIYQFRFNIRSRKRLRERGDMEKGAPLKDRVANSPEPQKPEDLIVPNLLFVVPRPVYIEGVELPGDNSTVNLVFQPIYRQIIPALPVYDLQGDFFTQLDGAIESAVIDFFSSHRVVTLNGQFVAESWPQNEHEVAEFEKAHESGLLKKCEASPLTYQHWLKLSKAGEDSPLERALRHLNFTPKYIDDLEGKEEFKELFDYAESLRRVKPTDEPTATLIVESKKTAQLIPSGIVPRFGFALMSFRFIEGEPGDQTKKLAEAILLKQTRFHEAEGLREQTAGERDGILNLATGQSKRWEMLVKSMVDQGVDANVAAMVLKDQVRTENIQRAPQLSTYVEGGASASVLVPAQGAPKPQPTSPST